MRRSLLPKLVAVSLTAALVSGCMLSRAVDRAFVGMTVRKPTYVDRKTTGAFLLPLTFAIDVATFPIQLILVAILGDNFPFTEPPDALAQVVASRDDFKKLSPAQQSTAIAELDALVRSGRLNANTALGLTEDGHWVVVELNDEQRQQLIVRAQGLEQSQTQALACR